MISADCIYNNEKKIEILMMRAKEKMYNHDLEFLSSSANVWILGIDRYR